MVPPVGGEMRARELWEMSIRRKEKLRARPRVIDRSLFATRERERESARAGVAHGVGARSARHSGSVVNGGDASGTGRGA